MKLKAPSLIFAAAAVLLLNEAAAVTVGIDNTFGNPPVTAESGVRLLSSTGVPLAEGSVVRVGFFNPENTVAVAVLSGNDLGAIHSNFQFLGEGTVTGGGNTTTLSIGMNGSGSGYLSGQVTNVSPTTNPALANARLFVLVYNQNSTTVNAATEWAVVTSNLTNFTLPGADSGSRNPSPSLVTGQQDVWHGQIVANDAGTITGIRLASAVVVPEPGVAALSVVAMAFMARRRRSA